MRRRTRARELALQFLYTLDVRGDEVRPSFDEFLRSSGASRVASRFATELVDGVRAHRADLDRRLAALSENWSLSRMPAVDRNILRLAAFELLHSRDVPVRVVLNEAIELGKRYSTAQSGAFVNALLDRLKAQRPFPAEPSDAPDERDEEEAALAHDETAAAAEVDESAEGRPPR
jgi:transcription antitermination factor NusB